MLWQFMFFVKKFLCGNIFGAQSADPANSIIVWVGHTEHQKVRLEVIQA